MNIRDALKNLCYENLKKQVVAAKESWFGIRAVGEPEAPPPKIFLPEKAYRKFDLKMLRSFGSIKRQTNELARVRDSIIDLRSKQNRVAKFLLYLANTVKAAFASVPPEDFYLDLQVSIHELNRHLIRIKKLDYQATSRELQSCITTLQQLHSTSPSHMSSFLEQLIYYVSALADSLNTGELASEVIDGLENESCSMDHPGWGIRQFWHDSEDWDALPNLEDEQIWSVLPEFHGQSISLETLLSNLDFKPLQALKEAYPREFANHECLSIRLVEALERKVKEDNFEPLLQLDTNTFLELLLNDTGNLGSNQLTSMGCRLMALYCRANKENSAAAMPIKKIFECLDDFWTNFRDDDIFLYSKVIRFMQNDDQLMELFMSPSNELADHMLLKTLKYESEVLWHQAAWALNTANIAHLKWMADNDLDLDLAEGDLGKAVLETNDTYKQLADNDSTKQMLSDQIARMGGKNKESHTFPYDHQVILNIDEPENPISEVIPLYEKNASKSALYNWNTSKNSITDVQGERRPFKGKYKLVISGHGNPFLMGSSEGTISASEMADKLVELIDSNGGGSPEKITLVSCNIGLHIPLYGCFAEQLTEELYHRGIDSVISSSSGFVHTLESGRKAYSTQKNLDPPVEQYFSRLNTFQTKDVPSSRNFKAEGMQLTEGLKRKFWIENGKVKSRYE